jgi:methyltransferase (TIGR00027 family)
VVLRSRFAEDCLVAAVSRGIRQFVSLGSGYDTFAYRQPDWAKALRIFEVDHPASQSAKKQRLTASGISLLPNLEFVLADFEKHSLREILARSSFDFSRPAFFSCLGVLVYLPPEPINALFELVGSLPKASELVLTFTSRRSASSTEAAFGQLAQAAAALGEPWRTYHEPEAIKEALLKAGFTSVDFLSPEEAGRLYFRGRTDGLPPPQRTAIARAVV